jgi:hypothetical protein
MNKKIINKIRAKREISQLCEGDIEKAYSIFENEDIPEKEKIDLTKELLRKVFSAFMSKKLLSLKDKEPEWILRKHVSTKERLPFYEEVYRNIFSEIKKASVIDLGAGINGFSYGFFNKLNLDINYTAIESVGQLVNLMNFYFTKKKIKGKAIHESLFNLGKIKEIIKKKKPKIVFLFKIIDVLEMIKKDYSKNLIKEIIPFTDLMVASFSMMSFKNKKPFFAKRKWFLQFIKENFKVLKDFEIGGERYFIFKS